MATRRRKDPSAPSFEENLEHLRGVVAKLEEGDLPLLESIETYREGIEVLQRCRALLDEARATVEVLSKEAFGAEGAGSDANRDAADPEEEDDDEEPFEDEEDPDA